MVCVWDLHACVSVWDVCACVCVCAVSKVEVMREQCSVLATPS